MNSLNKSGLPNILGHPEGLFVLFFTEMWERFSYYGMRALLVLFLVTTASKGGWGWERKDALQLYGAYTWLVYLTPIIGGYIADQFLGSRRSVVIGGFIIAAGHICLTLETVPTFYTGLCLIVLGTGFFKPNISAIVGQLYKQDDAAGRDAGYTLFYMGINAGAFFGILLCGYIGEKISWSYGFGLAGFFMILGAVQFYCSQSIFGDIGLIKEKVDVTIRNRFIATTAFFIITILLGAYIGKNASWPLGIGLAGLFIALGALQLYFTRSIFGAIERIKGPLPAPTIHDGEIAHVVRDRLLAIGIFSFFTIFFWMAFEQAGGSMTIFADSYTDRTLPGTSGMIFKICNTLMTVVPTIVLSWLLYLLTKATYGRHPLANGLLILAFIVIWGLLLWMLSREFADSQSSVPASWFGTLNSFFLVILAPMFSKIFENHWNPSGPVKFGIGLILLGAGFGVLAFGAAGIPSGAKTASVSMIFLILAYWLHTMGELFVSPVGLSFISKLAPPRLLGLMFGIWFVMTAIANGLAGFSGGMIDEISKQYSLSTFFLIYTAIPITAGLVLMAMNKWVKGLMHGVE